MCGCVIAFVIGGEEGGQEDGGKADGEESVYLLTSDKG